MLKKTMVSTMVSKLELTPILSLTSKAIELFDFGRVLGELE
jgi:hypothetical protein